MMEPVRKVIIANSQEIVRDAIATILLEHCAVEIVGKTAEGYSTVKLCRQLTPDILILDMGIVRPSGAEILTRVTRSLPDLKILAVSDDPSASSVHFALSHSTMAFITRGAKTEDYVNAVKAVLNGYMFLPHDLFDNFLSSRKNFSRSTNLFNLSVREMEVLDACASKELGSREVADVLKISMRTVEKHRHNIYKKSGCRNIEKIYALVFEAESMEPASPEVGDVVGPLRVVSS